MTFPEVLTVTGFSFLTALSGAMAPGPLLTYTIIRSMKKNKRGWNTGFLVIIGHSVLELILLLLLLAGLSVFFSNKEAIKAIGIIGGTFLSILGVLLLRDLISGKAVSDFEANFSPQAEGQISKSGIIDKFINRPILAGVTISMSNPYWWVWWATTGLGFLASFSITINQPEGIAGFYFGHEIGDLSWYFLVSVAVFFSRRLINQKVYGIILGFCGIFLVFFGLILAGNSMLFH